eukprot:TRINITY_DN2428_c0_g1_i8.p2 TRINITY_DN2428_c0_g1~~TRINITY_DN2428_c0_g1_i8.p2  ORF type:complete len:179 (+),score=15.76 TRINITY_DN2428_c0_g1_i8:1260-1796(+)
MALKQKEAKQKDVVKNRKSSRENIEEKKRPMTEHHVIEVKDSRQKRNGSNEGGDKRLDDLPERIVSEKTDERPKPGLVEEIPPRLESLRSTPSGRRGSFSSMACLICYDKTPDAVMLNCGHGGLCYSCSLELWNTSDECYLCREKIQNILQIAVPQSGRDTITVIGCSQKVELEDYVK